MELIKEHISLPELLTNKEFDDETLIEKVKEGEEWAFSEIVTRYMKKAYYIALGFTGNKEDAKDVAQDTFIKIFKAAEKFKTGERFFPWFYRIHINNCINFTRRKKIVSILSFSDFSQEHPDDKSSEFEAQQEEETDELKGIILKAISKLPTKQRKVVLLCDLEEIPQVEAAKILKCSEGTVRSRLFYARKKLKTILTEYVGNE